MHNKADPRIFLVAYLLFFAIGSRTLSETAAGIVVLGGVALALGLKTADIFGIEEKKVGIDQNLLRGLFLISVLAAVFETYRIGGLPLLNPTLLSAHRALYVMIGLLSVPLAAIMLANSQNAGWKAGLVPAAAVLLTALIGYRTNIVASMAIFSLIGYSKGLVGRKKFFGLLGVGLIVLFGASWLKVLAIGSGANPMEALFYRAEGTVSIFSRIADQPGGSADGKIMHSAFSSLTWGLIPGTQKGPRTLMAEMFGARENITFTTSLLGEPYLDFGIAGVLGIMLFLGLLLGGLSKAKEPAGMAAYAVLLGYALVEIETGILDMILFYYILAAAYLLASLKIRKIKSR